MGVSFNSAWADAMTDGAERGTSAGPDAVWVGDCCWAPAPDSAGGEAATIGAREVVASSAGFPTDGEEMELRPPSDGEHAGAAVQLEEVSAEWQGGVLHMMGTSEDGTESEASLFMLDGGLCARKVHLRRPAEMAGGVWIGVYQQADEVGGTAQQREEVHFAVGILEGRWAAQRTLLGQLAEDASSLG